MFYLIITVLECRLFQHPSVALQKTPSIVYIYLNLIERKQKTNQIQQTLHR